MVRISLKSSVRTALVPSTGSGPSIGIGVGTTGGNVGVNGVGLNLITDVLNVSGLTMKTGVVGTDTIWPGK